jgi:hypothetical protein
VGTIERTIYTLLWKLTLKVRKIPKYIREKALKRIQNCGNVRMSEA